METRQWMAIALAIGIGLFQPGVLLAAEHGGTTLSGKEHGGTPVTTQQIGADTVRAGGSAETLVSDEVAILHRAADALRRGEISPDLADQLEQLAEQHASR